MKIILTMVTVGIALAALIINSNGNIRADIRDNSAEIHDVRTEVADVTWPTSVRRWLSSGKLYRH